MNRLLNVSMVLLVMVGGWLLSGLLPGANAHAQEISSGEGKPVVSLERSGYFGGSTSDFVLEGNFIYLLAGVTLEVVDVSNGTNPTRIFAVQLPGVANTLDVENGMVYVGTVDHGLQIIDIWRSGGPMVVGSWRGRSSVRDVTVTGSRAYVVSESTMNILDVSNPAGPVLVGTYTDTHSPFSAVHVAGDLMLFPVVQRNCSAGSPGCETYLRIVDISNPAAPALLSSWTELSAFIYDVVVHNGYAYVADYRRNLYILDLSNPASPSLVSNWASLPPAAIDLSVTDGVLYVTVSSFSTKSVDAYALTNPTSPELLLRYQAVDSFAYFPQLQVANGKVAFISGGTYNDIEIVSFAIGGSAAKLGSYSPVGSVSAAVVVDPYLYVIADGVFYILSADLPISTPVGVWHSPEVDGYVGFATDGLHVFAQRGGSLHIDVLNLSNPTAPQLLSSFAPESGSSSLYLRGNTLYSLGFNKLQVFDVSNPAQPTKLSELTLQSAFSALVYGNYLYINSSAGVQIVDVSNPNNPQIVGNYNPPSSGTLSIVGSLLFIGSYQSFSLLDLANPTAPVLLNTVSVPETLIGRAARQGDMLYVGTTSGLMTVDIRDPSNLVVLNIFDGFYGMEPIVQGDRGYMPNASNGIYAMKITTFIATDFLYLPSVTR